MKTSFNPMLGCLAFVFIWSFGTVEAQQLPEKISTTFPLAYADILARTNKIAIAEKAEKWNLQFRENRRKAISFAQANGYPVQGRTIDGGYFALVGMDENEMPQYLSTNNLDAARTLSTDKVWSGSGAGFSLDGEDWNIGVWDGGAVRGTHQELDGRVYQIDNPASLSNHATHVSGTLLGSGVNNNAKGMAPMASLVAHDFLNDLSEMAYANSQDWVYLSNHSYGAISGWSYDDYGAGLGWYWWGDLSVSSQEDYKFGFYNVDARDFDDLSYDSPFYLMVKSAGNDRDDSHSGSHFVRNSSGNWVNSSSSRQSDGGNNGYDCISTVGCAKNVLTVGAIHDLPNGFSSSSNVNMSAFSGWGPTDDGRIKPDIVGNGVGVTSSIATGNSAYDSFNGTSMSTPNVAGSIALLREHAYETYGGWITSASLKALTIHTADDAGNNGPDYKYGWGVMNTLTAAEHISETLDFTGTKYLSEYLLENGDEREFGFYSDGTEPLIVTTVWTDPAGPVSSPILNSTASKLVNDIDTRLYHYLSNTEYDPWRLNPSSPSSNATRGDNFRDNVEQIYISDPEPGWYRFRVSHKGNLSGGEQWFSVVASGAYRSSCRGLSLIDDCEGTLNDGSSPINNYGNYSECTWRISPPGAHSINLEFTEFDLEENFDFLSVYDGTSENAPLLGTYTGNSLPPELVANSGSMFLKFTTDESVTAPGWTANYSCDACETPDSPWLVGDSQICTGHGATIQASGCNDCQTIWSTGATGNSINVTQGGTYSAHFINTCGDAGPSTSIFIEEVSSPTPADISPVGSTEICLGESITLTANNICNGCTVNWSNGQSGPTISVNSAGNYFATVYNFSNPLSCQISSPSNSVAVSVVAAPNVPFISASGATNICSGETIVLTASGVCAGCSVNWSNGMSGTSITVSEAGTYSATVIDLSRPSACQESNTSNMVEITVESSPDEPIITAASSTQLCPGENVTLVASNVCSGCVVNWSNGMSGTSITVSEAGTYSATVTDFSRPSACQQSPSSNEVMVSDAEAPSPPVITAVGSTNPCPGENVVLAASNVCTGCTVNWSNGMSGPNITVFTPGSYFATVVSPNCGSSNSSNIVVISSGSNPNAPVISAQGLTHFCEGETVVLTAENVCIGCTVLWSTGEVGPSIVVSESGIYTATVSNDCGVSSGSNVLTTEVFTAPPSPQIPNEQYSICPGQSIVLTPQNVCTGCTVLWSNGQTGSSLEIDQAGLYSVSVIDPNLPANCQQSLSSNTVEVTSGEAPATPNISASGALEICPGESVSLTASNVCTGCTVLWSNGQTGISIMVEDAGVYTAVVNSLECGVSDVSNSVEVVGLELPNSIPQVVALGNTVLCEGQSLTLVVTNSEDCSDCEIVWSSGGMGSSIEVGETGIYSAQFANLCGSGQSSSSMEVVEESFIPQIAVNGGCYLAAPNGSGYQWFFNGMEILDETSQFLTAEETGYYSVQMIGVDGCEGGSDPIFIEGCPTSVTETNQSKYLSIKPNPATSSVLISFRLPFGEGATIEIFSLDGKVIDTVPLSKMTPNVYSIKYEAGHLSSGVYLVKVSAGINTITKRLVILR